MTLTYSRTMARATRSTGSQALTALALTGIAMAMGLTLSEAAAKEPTPSHSAAAHAPTAAPAAWTPGTLRDTLNSLPAGRAEQGRVVHQQLFCASCHGDNGQAPTHNWPHLAGQKAAYTAKMLLDYQSRLRLEGRRAELMHDIMMSPQQIADVAAFYAAQPAPRNEGTTRPTSTADAKRLVRKGDPTRLITPCASCHGVAGQGGKLEAAALAGQNPLYFTRTLLDYQSGRRANDAAKGMSAFAKRLTRAEIEALAHYYADLPTGKK